MNLHDTLMWLAIRSTKACPPERKFAQTQALFKAEAEYRQSGATDAHLQAVLDRYEIITVEDGRARLHPNSPYMAEDGTMAVEEVVGMAAELKRREEAR